MPLDPETMEMLRALAQELRGQGHAGSVAGSPMIAALLQGRNPLTGELIPLDLDPEGGGIKISAAGPVALSSVAGALQGIPHGGLVLTATKSLQFLLGGAGSTVVFCASYESWTADGVTPAEADGVSNGTTPVEIVGAPSSGYRVVKRLNIYNPEASAQTVTVRVLNNATARILVVVTLDQHDTLVLDEDGRWTVTDSTGALKGSGGGTGLSYSSLTDTDWALDDNSPFFDTSASNNPKRGTVNRLLGLLGTVCEGRLTLASGTPVTTTDQLAKSTLYFTLYNGNRVRIYDGTRWKVYTFTEISLALTLTSGKNYDVFIYDNAGTLTLELSAAWTNDTTRADALTTQDGVYVKSGATTRLYLGTIRASASNQTEDSEKRRFVWNLYNRVTKPLFAQITGTASYTYTTATVRAVNANTTVGEGRFEIVCGLNLDMVQARVQDYAANTTPVNRWYGVGFDSTSTNHARNFAGQNPVATYIVPGQMSELLRYPGIGYHYLQWVEWSVATGTTTWYIYSAGVYELSMRGEWIC